MSLNEKIIKIRCALQSSNIKKSGKNKFQGFTYYELSDFLPMLNVLMEQDLWRLRQLMWQDLFQMHLKVEDWVINFLMI